MEQLLQDIRILEWSVAHHGTAAGYMLGDLGAEVIKIEQPGIGDYFRSAATLWGTSMILPGGYNVMFETANRNKLSITLDLSKSEGQQIFHDLVKKADVFVTNYRPSVLAKRNADYETLKHINPRLVYALASGYGSKGPEADLRSLDPVAQARSGLMWLVGDRDHDAPWQVVGGLFDQIGATLTAWGILGALYYREHIGRGQMVETSLLAAAIHAQAINVNATCLFGRPMRRHSAQSSPNPLSNQYRCADGKWILLAEPMSDRFWVEACDAIALPELGCDPRYATSKERREHCRELVSVFAEAFAHKPRDEWVREFREKNCQFAYSPVQTMEESVQDPQVVQNEYVIEVKHPHLGKIKEVGYPVKFSHTPPRAVRTAPEFGEHTEEVLMRLLSLSWDRIAQLREGGVI